MKHRIGIPLEQWPAQDQALWFAATCGDAIFDISPLTQWKPGTLKTAAGAYGIWLAWLESTGALCDSDPASRLTKESIKSFIKAQLAKGLSAVTVADRAHRVISVVAGMCSGAKICEAREIANRLEKFTRRQFRPRGQIAHAAVLFHTGLILAQQAYPIGLRTPEGARLHVDGLMIALLAACPTRIGTFCSLRLDHEMVRDSENWQMVISAENTKTNTMETRAVPTELTTIVDDYVQLVRPYLLARRPLQKTDRFFIGASGVPLQDQVMRRRIVQRTQASTGKRILPHSFRKSAITTLVLEQPQHAPSAPLLLSHAGTKTAERHYIIRQQMLALEHYHAALDNAASAREKPL